MTVGAGNTTTISPLPQLEAHLRRIAEDGYTILEDAIEPELIDEIDEALLKLEHDLGIVPADQPLRGRADDAGLQPARARETFETIPVHAHVLPVVEGVLDPGCLISSLSSIAIGPGREAQPIHADDQLIPLPKPARPDHLQHHVGAHRLHRGERRHPPRPRQPPARRAAHPLRRRYDSIAAEMPKGSVLVWVGSLWHGGGANRTDAAPGRHRDELLRGLHPPAGEPAARHPARRWSGRSPAACRSWSATPSTTGSSATSTRSTPPRSSSPRTKVSTWSGTC